MRFALVLTLAGCSGGPSKATPDGPAADAAVSPDAPEACSTTITYGLSWIHPDGHAGQTDSADGVVTWDGTCVAAGGSSYAVLSNGWRPYFSGHTCELALDHPGCHVTTACTTRIGYGSAWIPAANHPDPYDDVAGRVFWDGDCQTSGADSVATLSNGWAPHFTGTASCGLALRWEGCGGLYGNAVLPSGCADPGVTKVGDHYLMTCTSGGAANAFPIYSSTDLVHWTLATHVFSQAQKPAWATGDFWAPEIHQLITNDQSWEGAVTEGPFMIEHAGTYYLFYSGNSYANATYAVGVARASSPTGPFTKAAGPIVTSTSTWVGPGHNSVVVGPGGDLYFVYHAWNAAHDARYPLVDQITWVNGWPAVPGAPSTGSRPMP